MQGERWEPRPPEDRWEAAIAAHADIARDTSIGRGFLYRRGRLLVEPAVLEGRRPGSRHAFALLNNARADYARGEKGLEAETEMANELGLELLRVDDRVALPSLSRELRAVVPAGISIEHVFIGDPHRYHGADPAVPAPAPTDIPGRDGAGKGITIAVLDTGLWPKAGLPLPPVDPSDEEILDEDGDGLLDGPAGHGTFVTGLLLRHAPGATIIPRRLLTTPAGMASELEVAKALLEFGKQADILNCSFGGPAQDDAAPLVIERALSALPPSTVVVAAAGNQGDARPHWPAASKRVVGVAWAEKQEAGWALADDSSRGPWVNASAPGRAQSSFVTYPEPGVAPLPQQLVFEGGAEWAGTSFAAPVVSASLAALAARDGIPVQEAVYRLVDDPALDRLPQGGTLVTP